MNVTYLFGFYTSVDWRSWEDLFIRQRKAIAWLNHYQGNKLYGIFIILTCMRIVYISLCACACLFDFNMIDSEILLGELVRHIKLLSQLFFT